MPFSYGEIIIVVVALCNVNFLVAVLAGLALIMLFHGVWLFENWISYLNSVLELWTAERNTKRANLLQQESLGRYRRQRRMLLQQ
jgi:hypothetical protein